MVKKNRGEYQGCIKCGETYLEPCPQCSGHDKYNLCPHCNYCKRHGYISALHCSKCREIDLVDCPKCGGRSTLCNNYKCNYCERCGYIQ